MSLNLPYRPSPIREIAFKITTPSGKSYWPDVNISPRYFQSKDFIELGPDMSLDTTINLNTYSYKFVEVGTYSVIANYQNIIDPSVIDPKDTRIAWKGELNSNEVFLTIIP
jgi:hypothetical protein